MQRYELRLTPQNIFYYVLKKILKKKKDDYLELSNSLKIKLSNDKKIFAMNMELRPCFYKFRPRDIELQLRHQKFKLLPISNTMQTPDNTLRLNKSNFYSGLILKRLQDTACQYRSAINNKFLTVEYIKKREQNVLTTNYRLRLQLRPRPFYNKDLPY